MQYPDTSWRISVPTYNGNRFASEVEKGDKPEFGPPRVAVGVFKADGVRIVLGTQSPDDSSAPDIQIERQPNGWVIFLHPLGGSDPSGYVYFCDDGRSFIRPESGRGPTPPVVSVGVEEGIDGF